MKKMYFFLVALFVATTGLGQLFQQDFSSSTTAASYVSATPNNGQFNAVSTSGAGTVVTINTTGSNKLRYDRTAAANAGSFSRTTDFSPTPSTLMYKLDLAVSGTTTATTSAAVFQIGNAYGTANSAESNALTYARFALNTTTTNGTFQIRDITNGVNSSNLSGTQAILWVVNNSGTASSYRGPDGTNETIADDRTDIWAGTSKLFNDVNIQTTTQTITDLKFVLSGGSPIVDIDNMLIDPIPGIPVSNAPSAITSSSFTANWTTVSGVTGYRIDVATDAGFTTFVTGYNDLYVSGQATSSLVVNTNINPNTTYFYRVRGTAQYAVGEFASGNSGSQTILTYLSQSTADYRSVISGDYSTAGTWEYNYTGSLYQTPTTGPGSGNNVNVQNTHTVTLTANEAANGLTLQSTGNIILGSNNLVVGSTSGGSSTGYIQTNSTGTLTINNILVAAKTFPIGNSRYNPLTIANGSGHNWTARVEDVLNNVQPPYNTSKAVIRTWTITPSVNPPSAGADLTFQYDDSDPTQIGGSFITSEDVQLWHYGTSWIAASGAITPTGTPGGVRTITKTGWSQYSSFGIANISGPLPVTFASFSGYKDGSRNQLRWTTATESNNLGFDVQRSTDGINYVSIGFVNSLALNGNSSDLISYTFTDNAPAGARQYYRLRQEDLSGAAKLSNIVLIKGAKPSVLTIESVFPNPAKNMVNVIVATPVRDNITVMITDMAGRMMSRKVVNAETGSNTVPVDISHLQSGNYLVRVSCSEGCEMMTAKFVKQ